MIHLLHERSLLLQHCSPSPPCSSVSSSLFCLCLREFSRNLREAATEARGSPLCPLHSVHHGYNRDLHPLHRRISAVRGTRKVSRHSSCVPSACPCVFLRRCYCARLLQCWQSRRGCQKWHWGVGGPPQHRGHVSTREAFTKNACRRWRQPLALYPKRSETPL